MIQVMLTENQLQNLTSIVDVEQFGWPKGCTGVPAFVSKVHNTGTVGYKYTVTEVIKALHPKID